MQILGGVRGHLNKTKQIEVDLMKKLVLNAIRQMQLHRRSTWTF